MGPLAFLVGVVHGTSKRPVPGWFWWLAAGMVVLLALACISSGRRLRRTREREDA